MKTLQTVFNHFQKELGSIYDKSEINSFVFILAERILNFSKVQCLASKEKNIDDQYIKLFNNYLKELKKGKPIQYITGIVEFYGSYFRVNENVLIPRPETEELVDLIVEKYKRKAVQILDIGTGSGCIAISLKKHLPLSGIHALDISKLALDVARKNAESNNVKIGFYNEDILNPFEVSSQSKFDIIVSNPPYVLESEKESININVLNFEPHLALFVKNENPLIYYRAILKFAETRLTENGEVYFEINPKEAENMIEMVEKEFGIIQVIRDLSGKNRIARINFYKK